MATGAPRFRDTRFREEYQRYNADIVAFAKLWDTLASDGLTYKEILEETREAFQSLLETHTDLTVYLISVAKEDYKLKEFEDI